MPPTRRTCSSEPSPFESVTAIRAARSASGDPSVASNILLANALTSSSFMSSSLTTGVAGYRDAMVAVQGEVVLSDLVQANRRQLPESAHHPVDPLPPLREVPLGGQKRWVEIRGQGSRRHSSYNLLRRFRFLRRYPAPGRRRRPCRLFAHSYYLCHLSSQASFS